MPIRLQNMHHIPQIHTPKYMYIVRFNKLFELSNFSNVKNSNILQDMNK